MKLYRLSANGALDFNHIRMSLEKLREIDKAKPLLCLEVNPPRGVDFDVVFDRLEGRLKGVDYFNVTDSALACMKCSPLPFASALKARFGIEPLVNISCRDRNLIALQADLLSGWALGVRSVIALTGDAVSVGDLPEAKGVFEVNSIGLLKVIETLNSGKDLSGYELKGAPGFLPGVVVNPNAKNPSAELRRLQKKKAAGACYALSQPVFDRAVADSFFSEAAQIGLPILMGLFPIKSSRSAQSIAKVPGIKLSSALVSQLEGSAERDIAEISMTLCLELAEATVGLVAGYHVISGVTPKLALGLMTELVRRYRS